MPNELKEEPCHERKETARALSGLYPHPRPVRLRRRPGRPIFRLPSGASDGDALKVGIILSTGGLGDKNFNDMTYAGAQQAEKDFGIEFDYVETQSASDFLPNYRMFAESGEYDLITA